MIQQGQKQSTPDVQLPGKSTSGMTGAFVWCLLLFPYWSSRPRRTAQSPSYVQITHPPETDSSQETSKIVGAASFRFSRSTQICFERDESKDTARNALQIAYTKTPPLDPRVVPRELAFLPVI